MNILKTLLLFSIIVIGGYLIGRWQYMPFLTPASISPREEASFLKLDSDFSLHGKEEYSSFDEVEILTGKVTLFEDPVQTDYSF